MNQEQRDNLWKIFIEQHEPDFKKIMGYGKEEIEAIGINKFLETMGWEKEEHLTSYLHDKLHIVPCIECKKEFAVYEDDLGLCESCQKLYDLDSVFTYATDIAKDSGSDVTQSIKIICSAFYMNKEFRDTFRTDIPDEKITHALVRKKPQQDKNLGWRVLPLGELKTWKEKHFLGEFKLVRQDGKDFEKDGKTIFSNIEDVLV